MKRLVVGLMSGTSMDGIDAAVGEVTGSGESCRFRPLAFVTTPYPKQIREELLEMGLSKDHRSDLAKISSLNYTARRFTTIPRAGEDPPSNLGNLPSLRNGQVSRRLQTSVPLTLPLVARGRL